MFTRLGLLATFVFVPLLLVPLWVRFFLAIFMESGQISTICSIVVFGGGCFAMVGNESDNFWKILLCCLYPLPRPLPRFHFLLRFYFFLVEEMAPSGLAAPLFISCGCGVRLVNCSILISVSHIRRDSVIFGTSSTD